MTTRGVSGQNTLNDLTVNVSQAEMTALELEGELLMVQSQAVKHSGVEVMDVDRILHNIVAEVVGLSVDDPGLNSASGHPQSETAPMVISPMIIFGERSLAVNRATEFPSPDNESVL